MNTTVTVVVAMRLAAALKSEVVAAGDQEHAAIERAATKAARARRTA